MSDKGDRALNADAHENAIPATQSDAGRSEAHEAVPTPEGAREALVEQLAEERVQRYRSAIREQDAWALFHPITRAVMAVADAEIAAQVEAAVSVVRAERDEFKEASEERGQAAEEAQAEVWALREKVAKVEALRDKWLAVNVPSAEVSSWSHYAGDSLRIALSDPTTPDQKGGEQ